MQRRLQPLLSTLLAQPGDGRLAGLQRLDDRGVRPPGPVGSPVGLQQDAGVGQLAGGRRARGNQAVQRLAFLRAQFDDILLVHAPTLPDSGPTFHITGNGTLGCVPTGSFMRQATTRSQMLQMMNRTFARSCGPVLVAEKPSDPSTNPWTM